MATKVSDQNFHFVGNHRCLDFVNTQLADGGGSLIDLLETFEDFVAWARAAGIIESVQAAALVSRWSGTRQAREALGSARGLRAQLRETAERIVRGASVAPATIEAINELLRRSVGHWEVARVKGGFERRFRAEFDEPAQLLFPLAAAAAALLCESDFRLIKKCENTACVLFFYDTTKNHSRRWCSMSACGNRLKVAAHYQRRRAAQSA